MAPNFCANRRCSVELRQLRLGFESLEDRQLLSVSQLDESELSYEFVVHSLLDRSPHNQVDAVAGDDGVSELWAELNRDEILSNDGIIVSQEPQPGAGNPVPETPLPVIPIDDSIDPFTDCPGLDSDFHLPGDANHDGNVSFLDFLRLSHNFGVNGASWEAGDFDGDGRVTFGDFLVLSSNI